MLDENALQCDPCQIPVVDSVSKRANICGWVGPTIIPHLKAHNKKGNGKKWNKAEYEKKFPTFSLGRKYVPPQDVQDRLFAARDKRIVDVRAAKEVESQPAYSSVKISDSKKPKNTVAANESIEEMLQARFEILWDQVNRDVPAEQFARDAARAEFRIEEINRRYEAAFLRSDYDTMNKLMPQLEKQQDQLRKCMEFLDMTVKSRREKNQLGNDTVSQLVSNFAATLRRMSTEKRQTFDNRVKEVRRVMEETRRQKLLSEALDEKIEDIQIKAEMSDSEYEQEISKYIERVGV